FEKADGVGGTWYWNPYPGARCDSEIMYYSFFFLPDLEQEWPLAERYPGQPEILRYLEHVADRLCQRPGSPATGRRGRPGLPGAGTSPSTPGSRPSNTTRPPICGRCGPSRATPR